MKKIGFKFQKLDLERIFDFFTSIVDLLFLVKTLHGLESGSDSAKSLDANLTNSDPQLIKCIVAKFFGMLNVHNTVSISFTRYLLSKEHRLQKII